MTTPPVHPLALSPQYDALVARIIVHLAGDVLPSCTGQFDLERVDQRVAIAVCKATGMTPERWDKLDVFSREPWLEETLTKLEAEPNPPAATPVLTVNAASPSRQRKRGGRPNAMEKGKDTLVLAALLRHHGYYNGTVSNYAPASVRDLAKASDGRFSTAAVTRFLQRKKVTHDQYAARCHNDAIGVTLKIWLGEGERLLELLEKDGA